MSRNMSAACWDGLMDEKTGGGLGFGGAKLEKRLLTARDDPRRATGATGATALGSPCMRTKLFLSV